MAVRYIELSAPQDSIMGIALNHLYYHNDDLLNMIETSGYPHNGGYHTLVIKGNNETILAWLDLFLGVYPSTLSEITALKNEIIKSDKKVIKLFDLKRRNPQKLKQKWYRIKGLEFFRRHGDPRIEGPHLRAIPSEYLSVVCPKCDKVYLLNLLIDSIKGNEIR